MTIIYDIHYIFSGILSHKIEVNRARLHFETTGDGPSIVLLLPGALGTCSRGFQFNIRIIDVIITFSNFTVLL